MVTSNIVSTCLDRFTVEQIAGSAENASECGFEIDVERKRRTRRENNEQIGVACFWIEIVGARPRAKDIQSLDIEPLAGGDELVEISRIAGCIQLFV